MSVLILHPKGTQNLYESHNCFRQECMFQFSRQCWVPHAAGSLPKTETPRNKRPGEDDKRASSPRTILCLRVVGSTVFFPGLTSSTGVFHLFKRLTGLPNLKLKRQIVFNRFTPHACQVSENRGQPFYLYRVPNFTPGKGQSAQCRMAGRPGPQSCVP